MGLGHGVTQGPRSASTRRRRRGVGVDHRGLPHQPRVALQGGPDRQLAHGEEGRGSARRTAAAARPRLRVQAERRRREHGTSTAAPRGRLSISPGLATLAWMVAGVPVTMEWMTCGAYSVALLSSGRGSPAASAARVALVLGDVLLADAGCSRRPGCGAARSRARGAGTRGRTRRSVRWSRWGSSRAGGTCRPGPGAAAPRRAAIGVQPRVQVLPSCPHRSSHAWWLTRQRGSVVLLERDPDQLAQVGDGPVDASGTGRRP